MTQILHESQQPQEFIIKRNGLDVDAHSTSIEIYPKRSHIPIIPGAMRTKLQLGLSAQSGVSLEP